MKCYSKNLLASFDNSYVSCFTESLCTLEFYCIEGSFSPTL